MGRHEATNVDFFPCPCGDDRVVSILESRWGNDGFCLFYRLLKRLGDADYHFIDLREADAWEDFLVHMKVSEIITLEMLEKLASMGIVDKELWSHRIIWSDSFTESVKDVWSKRKANLPQKPLFLLRDCDLPEQNEGKGPNISATDIQDGKSAAPEIMNEETGGFSKELASLIIKIREKYQAPEIEAQVVLFVTSNDLKSNQKAMLHCLEEFIKHENGIDGSNVKSHLEALLNRICNAEKLDNTSPEETKVSLQNLGSIMTKAELQTPHIVHTEKPKPEIIKRKKEKCRKCGELQILELLEKGICVFCKPAVLTKCIGCGRTVGKNLLNKETGTCVHC